jgi:hypothetical protein
VKKGGKRIQTRFAALWHKRRQFCAAEPNEMMPPPTEGKMEEGRKGGRGAGKRRTIDSKSVEAHDKVESWRPVSQHTETVGVNEE